MTNKTDAYEELQWIKYRLSMLDIIDKKLFIMKEFVQKLQDSNLNKLGVEKLNHKLSNLASQIKALYRKSRKNCT
ncbi:MAG: hypothetical protein LKE46_08430 [Clostridium sp.]|jgi:septation ring formation regulator EzrA|uniref:hypothetical protein n=1 Tax=Clostridium sp. TaxID=1506 RepID=UPI0025C6C3CB|nr:hypothetical protein [Clostridium sp.]MCH3964291.1 hypothetical protein [Clostridium sp.]MCI1870555.1 hypothetical protein [Clostridium sp.]